MNLSPTRQVSEMIDDFSKQPAESRDAFATVKRIMEAADEDLARDTYSAFGLGLREMTLKAPDLLGALGAVFYPGDKPLRAKVLASICSHFPDDACKPEVFDMIFTAFQDVINEPHPNSKQTPIFAGMGAESTGKYGMLASMLAHGADPTQKITEVDGRKHNAIQSAEGYIINSSLASIRAKQEASNTPWRRIIAMMKGEEVGPPPERPVRKRG